MANEREKKDKLVKRLRKMAKSIEKRADEFETSSSFTPEECLDLFDQFQNGEELTPEQIAQLCECLMGAGPGPSPCNP